MGIYNGTIQGKIISKEEAVGTKSAGLGYYIIPEGKYKHWGGIHLRKKVMRWQKDPVLHQYIGENVEILAEIIETKDTITVEYIEVKKI